MLIDDVPERARARREEQSPNRLIYATPVLTAPVHTVGLFAHHDRACVEQARGQPVRLARPVAVGRWPDSTSNLITRGWADPQNAASLTRGGNYDSRTPGHPLVPGKFVTMTFDLEPDDQIVPAGKRIALMILSSDRDFTLWPKPGTELTIDLDDTDSPCRWSAADAWQKAVR